MTVRSNMSHVVFTLLLQCLHAVETHAIITFLPTALMQLFEVLAAATKEAHDIAVNSLRSVVHSLRGDSVAVSARY